MKVIAGMGKMIGRLLPPALLSMTCGVALPADIKWWTTHATVKVRPADAAPPTRAATVELSAARNEFEAFQVVIHGSQPLDLVDVAVSDLAGPNGASIPQRHSAIYLEIYASVARPSSPGESTEGEWPDALIPKVDRYRKSPRNAFPFRVAQGRNQTVWIELFVPPNTPPGRYSGRLTLTAEGQRAEGVPILLNVWDFTLPVTSTLRNSFGFNGVAALKRHYGSYTGDEELLEITALYARAALQHRISIHGGTMAPPPFSISGGRARIDWRNYDREVGPFLDGTALRSDEPLAGARFTSIDLRTHGSADTDEKKVQYWREFTGHMRQKGWLDRLYHYVWDEPPVGKYPQVAARARLARQADPALRNLVTVSLDASLAGLIDIWTPLINCLEVKPGFPEFCEKTTVPFSAYQPELRQGRSLWFYQSCASHGCTGGAAGDYFKGWPSYMIDAPAVSNRIMGWLSWKYRVEGELYFAMNEAYGPGDPWENVFMHSGNGDGTLFYPGTPSRIGGSGHIPIESIRLKLIREGLEDYEYLAMLARSGQEPVAGRSVARIVQSLYLWEKRPDALYRARQEMGEKLSQSGGSRPAPSATGVGSGRTPARGL